MRLGNVRHAQERAKSCVLAVCVLARKWHMNMTLALIPSSEAELLFIFQGLALGVEADGKTDRLNVFSKILNTLCFIAKHLDYPWHLKLRKCNECLAFNAVG